MPRVIMGVLSLLERLLGRPAVPRDDYVHSTVRFMELDLGRLAKRLALEAEGRRRGAIEQPAAGDDGFDDIEQKIIATIDAEKKDSHEKLIDQLTSYADRIRALALESLVAEVAGAGIAAAVDFKARVHAGRDLLIELHRGVIELSEEMEDFKRAHGLKRSASFPRSRRLNIGFALALLLIETVLNGSFLAKGHELGLLGGFFMAGAIACANVGSGLAVGWHALPNLWHQNVARKMAGAIIALAYAALIASFNLYVAHLRDALASDFPEEAGVVAWASLLSDPAGIVSGDSWMLFAMGLAFSLAAAVDGLAMDDVYPGYGALARRKSDLNEDYAAQKKVLMDELEEVRAKALARLASAARDIERRRGEFHRIVEVRRHMRAAFDQHLDHLEHAANFLLACYRNANREARNTPAPSRFGSAWAIERPTVEVDRLAGEGASLDQKVAEALAEMPRQQQRIHAEYEAALYRYLTIEQLTPEEASEHGAVGQAAT